MHENTLYASHFTIENGNGKSNEPALKSNHVSFPPTEQLTQEYDDYAH